MDKAKRARIKIANYYHKQRNLNKQDRNVDRKAAQDVVINHNIDACCFQKWSTYFPFTTFIPGSSTEKALETLKIYFERNFAVLDTDEIEKKHALCIDFTELTNDADLKEQFPNLASDVQSNPDLYLKMLNLAFHQALIDNSFGDDPQNLSMSNEIQYINVRLINYEPVTYLRNLKANYYGKFVSVRGTVVKVGNVKPLATTIAFTCVSCREELTLTLLDGKYSIPNECVTPECKSRSFIPYRNSRQTTTIDSQIIKIQEIMIDENRETGRIPRTVECALYSDLVDVCVPGDMVTVSGIVQLSNIDESTSRNNKEKCLFLLFIHANSLVNVRDAKCIGDTESQKAEFSLKELYAIREIHSEENIFKLIVGSLCPSIYGHELVKAGLVLGLFGGTLRYADDKGQIPIRSDPHILAVGDPGLGKSQMLQAVANAAPRGVFVCGNTTTTSGLTVTLSKESGSGDYALEAGALVLGDQGCCCIDEFDKMGSQHQALLEAMEQQSISIAKAGIVCSLPARTSIIAAANPVAGHYNKAKTLAENLKLSGALLSRFDLVFILLDKPDDELDCILSDHVMAIHSGMMSGTAAEYCRGAEKANLEDNDFAKEQWNCDKALSERLMVTRNEKFHPLPLPLLRKYIAYARKYVHPKLSTDATNVLQNFYLALRRHYRGPDSTPVTTRQLESLIRLTEARAKLELREKATPRDAEDVIEIMKSSLVDIYIDAMGELNLERSFQGSGMSKRKQIKRFITELTRIAARDCNSLFSFDQMRQLALSMKLQTGNFEEFVVSLNIQNFMIKKGSHFYQLQTAGF